MPYPSISDYKKAVKYLNNRTSNLTNLISIRNDSSGPIGSAGSFATVFQVEDNQTKKKYALKCFTRENSERKERYEKISKFLQNINNKYFCEYQFLDNEIVITPSGSGKEELYPILKMEWIEGETLGSYLKDKSNSGKYQDLEILYKNWLELAKEIYKLGIAHGDLKHDNMIINSYGEIKLIDYDGMFVPALFGKNSVEEGSPNYQHPKRNSKIFDTRIDIFSFIIIAISIKAISLNNKLLNQFSNDENIIFVKDDFVNLKNSQIYNELTKLANNEINNLLIDLEKSLNDINYVPTFLDIQLNKLKKDLDEAKQQINKLEQEIKDCDNLAKDLLQKSNNCTSNNQNLRNDLDKANQQINQLEQELTHCSDLVTNLSQQLNNFKLNGSNLQNHFNQATQEINQLENKKKELTNLLNSCTSNNQNLRNDLNQANQKINQLEKEIKDSDNLANQFRTELKDCQSNNKNIQNDLDQANQQINKLKQDLKDSDNLANQFRTELKDCQSNNQNLQNNNDKLKFSLFLIVGLIFMFILFSLNKNDNNNEISDRLLNRANNSVIRLNDELVTTKNELSKVNNLLDKSMTKLTNCQSQTKKLKNQLAQCE